ncbi:MAG: hypothetical protein FJY66_00725 [Calditrichaeota bacterium]|nr:hypothetical protein [Calditrichota bacterium]
MPYTINNDGVGSDSLLTFSVNPTANQDFTRADLDANLTAAAITGNNQVGMGSAGSKLFGKVVAVSEELQSGTTVPAYCTVQARGVARFKYGTPTPVVNEMVELDGTGKVRRGSTSTDIPTGGHKHKGQVIAVDTTNTTCDVWLD